MFQTGNMRSRRRRSMYTQQAQRPWHAGTGVQGDARAVHTLPRPHCGGVRHVTATHTAAHRRAGVARAGGCGEYCDGPSRSRQPEASSDGAGTTAATKAGVLGRERPHECGERCGRPCGGQCRRSCAAFAAGGRRARLPTRVHGVVRETRVTDGVVRMRSMARRMRRPRAEGDARLAGAAGRGERLRGPATSAARSAGARKTLRLADTVLRRSSARRA